MTFKTILAVTSPDRGTGDLKLAAALCEEIGAHLAVLAVALAAPPPIGEYAAVMSDAWLQERQADMDRLQKCAASATAFLATSAVSSDISSEYQEETWADEAIGRRARYADLVFLGPELFSNPLLKGKVLEGALFSSGKPLFLVPEGAKASLRPKRVMIAWDSRLEASNAVSRAMVLLSAADDVHVVLVDPVEGDGGQGAEPGADIATYLARHGVKVTVDRLTSQGRGVADALRQHAVDMAAELLVMGAYGHSRLRERIFGGVTRSMVETPPLPVFLAR
ncbi:universal stress protein [Mesorhizobium sp. ASY16-5R]|uniref:universal stress protein n=1 Tax=Mesorhizobium sp. ASY16-5R TaxID=3445772 RepID=UPI003F9F34FF